MSVAITDRLISRLSQPKFVSGLLALRREASRSSISKPEIANFTSELFEPQKIIQVFVNYIQMSFKN